MKTPASRGARARAAWMASLLAASACGGAKVPSQSTAAEGDDAGVEGSTADESADGENGSSAEGHVDPPDDSCFRQVSAGGGFTCVVKADGTLWCWGVNTVGQLGLGNTESPRLEPTQVTALGADVARVMTGRAHACAVMTDGTAWCWGDNEYGQLGDGTYLDRSTPGKVRGLDSEVVQMSAGGRGTCAVKKDGTLWCWGYGPLLGVGLPAFERRVEPVQVTALGSDVAQVSVAGASHTCAVKKDDTLWCWGRNVHGQLGDGTTDDRLDPIQVIAVGDDVTQVSARSSGTCVVKAEGTLWCWGTNRHGEVGDGTIDTPKMLPVRVEALGSSVIAVSTRGVMCARDDAGVLWCWGKNQTGGIGDGSLDTTCEIAGSCEMPRTEPVRVAALDGHVLQGSSGDGHVCARLGDDTVWCWGLNTRGQLGDGTTEGEPCGLGSNVEFCRPSPVRALIECP
jgi:alpha-tubulin suppressor-like RCC1 family protein